ncbi:MULTISPECIES: TonB-dependent receptor [unclassified Lentimicrobium]|uniref:SusC/RagA family TonB-linked outer membrane protein n=1 Tax=unclassified Lentimicrobium TaxID=2677434 RepID=UPI001557624B|nr:MULTISPECIES: TonB-dependent receptor [unclassified Lentimicrobium]NPD47318.1 TonB-dependent receptor [Lentimicrobium sp. S6]NPD84685.1 TonB-dependent receptor [Lentimicrobium sp. L6]
MKNVLLVVFALMLTIGLQAQSITVSGRVFAEGDDLGLPGATILEKGTTNGVVTDFDGNYSISVSPDAVLVFSFVGMAGQEMAVEGRTQIDVTLSNSTTLDEVVVIGYGEIKKKDVTGAVSQMNAEKIEKLKPVKVEQALQGTMAGVNVTSQSGAPGSGYNIRIRGVATNGDAAPLVIVDGYVGDLGTLSPSDIESVTVLKDAQAAIYGASGANGVILVKTKQGKKNSPTRVTLNSSLGMQETSRKIPLLDATEYAAILNESYAAAGDPIPYPDLSGLGQGTNWQDELFQTAPLFDNNLSVYGGTEKSTYTLSASDLRQQGIIGGDKTGFNRSTARLSLTTELYEWLNFSTNVSYSHIDRKTINDFGLASVLFNALNMPSVHPVYGESGDYFLAPSDLGIEVINPMAQIANTYNDYDINKLFGNASLDASFAQYFKATARIGFNTAYAKSKSFSPIVDYGGKVFDVSRSSVYQDRNNYNDYTFDAFVTYERTFNETHHVTAMLGTTVLKSWGDYLGATGYDVPNNSVDFADISLTNGLVDSKNIGSYVYDTRKLSYFARMQYDYKGKYLISAMLRRDASMKFGPENAAAYFPSVTGGWILSDEAFMKDINNVDLVKLRGSYGILGNDRIGDFLYLSQLSGEAVYVFDNMLTYGTAIGPLPNPSVKWERSKQFDLGADLSFFRDKLDFTVDYYSKVTDQLLIGNIPVSGILGITAPGASGPTVNAGAVKNSGLEFSVGYRGQIVEGLKFNVNYNVTTIRNEVLEVDNGTGFIEGGNFSVGQPLISRMEEGQPIGYFYGYQTDGIFQTQAEVDAHPSQIALGAPAQPGDFRFKDSNNDGVINTEDRVNLGNPIPDVVMGFSFSLDYKGIDFAINAYASLGNDIVRNYERAQPNVNRMSYILDRWTGPGTTNEVPRVTTAATANNVFSDFYVEDGSYLRIQKIQLGYTIPERWTSKASIQKFRLFASIDNPFTFTNYTGFDPAASNGSPIGAGIDYGFYPASRIYTFGFSLNL